MPLPLDTPSHLLPPRNPLGPPHLPQLPTHWHWKILSACMHLWSPVTVLAALLRSPVENPCLPHPLTFAQITHDPPAEQRDGIGLPNVQKWMPFLRTREQHCRVLLHLGTPISAVCLLLYLYSFVLYAPSSLALNIHHRKYLKCLAVQ